MNTFVTGFAFHIDNPGLRDLTIACPMDENEME